MTTTHDIKKDLKNAGLTRKLRVRADNPTGGWIRGYIITLGKGEYGVFSEEEIIIMKKVLPDADVDKYGAYY
jgi:hypothetical protein